MLREPMGAVTLHCANCDRRMPYFVKAEDNIPVQVETLEHSHCDLCDPGGLFLTETWYDGNGIEVIPI